MSSVGDYTRPSFGGSARSKRKLLYSRMDSQSLNQSTFVAFCHFDTRTSEDQLSFKEVSCETSHFGIVAVKFRDAVPIYSRVEVRIDIVEKLKTSCQHFFNANCLLLNGVTSTVRTVGHAIPYHTRKLNI